MERKLDNEIPAREWEALLEEFSRAHRAWLASVESCAPGAPAHVHARELPLQAITADTRSGRVTGVEIRFQRDAAREAVRIEAPASIRVDVTPEGTERGLEIIDETGVSTRVRFRAAPRTELLDGITPGEIAKTDGM